VTLRRKYVSRFDVIWAGVGSGRVTGSKAIGSGRVPGQKSWPGSISTPGYVHVPYVVRMLTDRFILHYSVHGQHWESGPSDRLVWHSATRGYLRLSFTSHHLVYPLCHFICLLHTVYTYKKPQNHQNLLRCLYYFHRTLNTGNLGLHRRPISEFCAYLAAFRIPIVLIYLWFIIFLSHSREINMMMMIMMILLLLLLLYYYCTTSTATIVAAAVASAVLGLYRVLGKTAS